MRSRKIIHCPMPRKRSSRKSRSTGGDGYASLRLVISTSLRGTGNNFTLQRRSRLCPRIRSSSVCGCLGIKPTSYPCQKSAILRTTCKSSFANGGPQRGMRPSELIGRSPPPPNQINTDAGTAPHRASEYAALKERASQVRGTLSLGLARHVGVATTVHGRRRGRSSGTATLGTALYGPRRGVCDPIRLMRRFLGLGSKGCGRCGCCGGT
jgi:hypothetical protein